MSASVWTSSLPAGFSLQIGDLSQKARRELAIHTEPDPFRVGERLAAFPCRVPDGYAVLRNADGIAIGLQCVFTLRPRINGVDMRADGMGGFYLRPEWRGVGLGAQFNAEVHRVLWDPLTTAAVVSWCEPALVRYYAALGAQELEPIPVLDRSGQPRLSGQRLIYWPKAVDTIDTFELEGRRW